MVDASLGLAPSPALTTEDLETRYSAKGKWFSDDAEELFPLTPGDEKILEPYMFLQPF